MDSDPVFLLSTMEIGRLPIRRGSCENELVVELEGEPDFEIPLELVDLDPLSTDSKMKRFTRTSTSSKSPIHASRLGVLEAESLPDLGFLRYVPRRRERRS